jgi:hypothetical protein
MDSLIKVFTGVHSDYQGRDVVERTTMKKLPIIVVIIIIIIIISGTQPSLGYGLLVHEVC